MKKDNVSQEFVAQVNAHMGIPKKICRIYFADADDRDDAFQEMMFQLWRSFAEFKGNSKFSTWMYRVCLNTALTFRRKNRVSTETLEEKHVIIPSQETEPMNSDVDLLFSAISKLSSLNKAIIALYLDELSYEEIAAITGLTKSNVSVRLVRIKKELESMLINSR